MTTPTVLSSIIDWKLFDLDGFTGLPEGTPYMAWGRANPEKIFTVYYKDGAIHDQVSNQPISMIYWAEEGPLFDLWAELPTASLISTWDRKGFDNSFDNPEKLVNKTMAEIVEEHEEEEQTQLQLKLVHSSNVKALSPQTIYNLINQVEQENE